LADTHGIAKKAPTYKRETNTHAHKQKKKEVERVERKRRGGKKGGK